MITAGIINRKPNPYPKVIPATHIEGDEGIRIVGNNATVTKTRSARTGILNEDLSQFIIGIIPCKEDTHTFVRARATHTRTQNIKKKTVLSTSMLNNILLS